MSAAIAHNARAVRTTQSLPDEMQAVVQAGYGGPEILSLATVPVPSPGPGEVLVRVLATSLNFGDGAVLTARPWPIRLAIGLRRPRQPVFGLDVAGEVVALGEGVEGLAIGDRVFGELDGAMAEYVAGPAEKLARIPEGVDPLHAAAAPVAGVTAVEAMRAAGLQAGQRVLVIGASGGVGHFAVQVARAMGAEVTGVCSGRNRALVEGLGAEVVDYTTTDYTDTDARYDVILDLVASAPLAACRRLLTPDGTYLASVGKLGRLLGALATSLFDRRVKVLTTAVRTPVLDALGRHLASGAVRPSVERVWSMAQIGEAMAHQLTGRARGKCVVRVADAPDR